LVVDTYRDPVQVERIFIVSLIRHRFRVIQEEFFSFGSRCEQIFETFDRCFFFSVEVTGNSQVEQDVYVILDGFSFPQYFDRLFQFSLDHQYASDVDIRQYEAWIRFEGSPAYGNRFFVFLLILQYASEIEVGFHIFGIGFYGLLERFHRLVGISRERIGRTQVVMRVARSRIEFERPQKGGYGIGIVSVSSNESPDSIGRLRRCRIEFGGFLEGFQGFLVFSVFFQGDSAFEIVFRVKIGRWAIRIDSV
jgi:hypothetical protein